jgi:hypothetical protein
LISKSRLVLTLTTGISNNETVGAYLRRRTTFADSNEPNIRSISSNHCLQAQSLGNHIESIKYDWSRHLYPRACQVRYLYNVAIGIPLRDAYMAPVEGESVS